MPPRTAFTLAVLVLSPMALAACVGGGGFDPRAGTPDAVLEAPGSAPRLAACLLAAYAGDPFRFRVAEDDAGVRITAFGMPSGRDPRRSMPRFSIEVGQAGQDLVRVTLRNARTLLGPGAEIERLRTRDDGAAATSVRRGRDSATRRCEPAGGAEGG